METGIHNTSEIGRLKKVLLHRPGQELENLTPEHMARLLFDDIPYLRQAQEEHDAFADCLRRQGVEVLYLTDLAVNSITSGEVRRDFINQFLDGAGVRDRRDRELLEDYLGNMPDREMVSAMMAGVRRSELHGKGEKLADMLSAAGNDSPFAADPMPNLYFTRDPLAVIGNGVSIHNMRTAARNRETLFGKLIFEHNPEYMHAPKWYGQVEGSSLEGGDILILSPEVLAAGISLRTKGDAVDALAENILRRRGTGFKKILAFDIPKRRAYMHLDTVFTMVDRDKFTVHPNILPGLTVYVMELDEDRKMKIGQEAGPLEDILKRHLGLDRATLIECGEAVDAAREQWSDGSNTLAVAPGEVVVYDRNQVTNRSLEEAGIRIHAIPSSELSRGRGGPRCMSMPLWREDV